MAEKKKRSSLRRGGRKKGPAVDKKADRPVLTLSDKAIDHLRRYVPAKVLYDFFESNLDNEKEPLKELLWESYLDLLWSTKAQPKNPNLEASSSHLGREAPDLKSMFMVVEKWSVQVPDFDEDEEEVEEAMAKLLTKIGLTGEKAEELVENELDFEPKVSIDVTALCHGSYSGGNFTASGKTAREAGDKLMDFLTGETDTLDLSEAERDAIEDCRSTDFSKVIVMKGFLQRVAGYCPDRKTLGKLLKTIKPQFHMKGAEFGISDPLDEKNERLLAQAANILGTKLGVNEDDDDEDDD